MTLPNNTLSRHDQENHHEKVAQFCTSVAKVLGWEPSELLEYLGVLSEEYFSRFDTPAIVEHIKQLTALSYTEPIHVSSNAECTVLSIYTFDKPGVFSFLSGVLGSIDFHILGGVLYSSILRKAWNQKVVICELRGKVENGHDTEQWVWQLQQRLSYIFRNFARSNDSSQDIMHEVMHLIANKLQHVDGNTAKLYPISMHIDNAANCTKLDIYSEDTSFFLYLFSHVLYIHKLNIVQMDIHTDENKIHDTIWFTDIWGGKIYDEDFLNRIRLMALVTKQLSYSLSDTPGPFQTMYRFYNFIQDFSDKRTEQLLDILLGEPSSGRNLALLLGSSDFLWEDFIRIQQENILPLLSMKRKNELRSLSEEKVESKLISLILAKETFEEKVAVLNAFKDRESYLIDIDHILNEDLDFFFLSQRLSNLAEVIVRAALLIAEEEMNKIYGAPRSISGLATDWAVFGLGKLGGRALGYASDLEILFIYSDDGKTIGPKQISNRDYFNRMFQLACTCIHAKQEGIFHVDTRLRPYGEDGPLAVHINQFVSYYGYTGDAHSIEKLALIRLRPIAGVREFFERIIHIRDQLIYQTQDNIVIADIRDARKKQLADKVPDKRLNAKFSPGALVDIEYNVQILQIIHGANEETLRVPDMQNVLRNLGDAGVVDAHVLEHIIKANAFFRNLINGLRMLRGNAQDLFLPPYSSEDFAYLAQRLRYNKGEQGVKQLQIDFEMHTAHVRSFVKHQLGKESLSMQGSGTIVDVILKGDFTVNDFTKRVLSECSIKDEKRALENIKSLAGSDKEREHFLSLIIIVWDVLQKCIDPDMALNNWERYSSRIADRAMYYQQLLSQPRRAEMLITVCSASIYLADLLIKHPEFLAWLSIPRHLIHSKNFASMRAAVKELFDDNTGKDPEHLLHYVRQREILRIATRDICLGIGLEEITKELSILARTVMSVALELAQNEQDPETPSMTSSICVLAFGKLGGEELNYSSDIDLLCIYSFPDQKQGAQVNRSCQKVFQRLIALTEGHASMRGYRIDLRLSPYGANDKIVHSYASCVEYYQNRAELWELQAALKLSPMVGDIDLGERLLSDIRLCMHERLASITPATIVENIKSSREQAISVHVAEGIDVKNGVGGIRDIEFLVQGLQLIHCKDYPVLSGNTLQALGLLKEHNLIQAADTDMLYKAYVLLRKVEHALQIQEDRQLHVIHEKIILSHLVDKRESFDEVLKATLDKVRNCYLQYLSVYADMS